MVERAKGNLYSRGEAVAIRSHIVIASLVGLVAVTGFYSVSRAATGRRREVSVNSVRIEQSVSERNTAEIQQELAAREFVERQLAAGVVQWLTPDQVRELGKGCIDGRQTLEDCDGKIPCSPGEEVGETIRQVAAIAVHAERRSDAWNTLVRHIPQIVDLFQQYGPYGRHTDDHAHPEEFGCGYLRLIHENPELYAVENQDFVKQLVKFVESKPRPIDKLVTLEGKHDEQAVLVVQFEGNRIGRIIPEYEGIQNFVVVPQVEQRYRAETFPALVHFCNTQLDMNIDLEQARSTLEDISEGHQALALGVLADGKPTIDIVFGPDEQVKSVRRR